MKSLKVKLKLKQKKKEEQLRKQIKNVMLGLKETKSKNKI